MVAETLYKLVEAINQCHLKLAVDNVADAKSSSLQCVRLLNELSKKSVDAHYKTIINQCSRYSIELYDQICRANPLGVNEKIVWLNSRPHAEFYYPVVDICKDLSTSSEHFIQKDLRIGDDLRLPPSSDATFQEVDVADWSTDADDLSGLYQDLLSNCSFVSSFLSIVNSGKTDLLLDIIQPRSSSHLYSVVLHVNGCRRVIYVDNRLPILKDDARHLTIRSLANTQLYWPAIIEKAYLKVLGTGYSIDGSNMAFDTFGLTGWIPEIFRITDGRLPAEVASLVGKFENKEILMGLGTGKISKALSEIVGLISHHDYMIAGFNKNKITLKNSWLSNDDEKRTIDVDATDLFQFHYLYINWDPSAFKHSHSVNFISTDKDGVLHCVYNKSQYVVVNDTASEQEVWLLLQRYIQKNITGDVIMDLDVYHSNSTNKLTVSGQYPRVHHGKGTNGRFQLVKMTVPPQSRYAAVVNSTVNSSMTLTMYHNMPDSKLVKPSQQYPAPAVVDDEWDYFNAGGSPEYSTYIKNPQYNVEVTEVTDLLISLIVPELSRPISFQLFYSEQAQANRGMRAFEESSLIFDGEYTAHHQYNIFKDLQPGFYRLVCNCQNAGVRSAFKIHALPINGAPVPTVTKIPSAWGLFQENTRYDWNGTSRFKVNLTTSDYNCRATFHLQHSSTNFAKPSTRASMSPMMRGSLFNGATSQPVCINETWANSLYGVFIDFTFAQPGHYILLVERFEPGDGTLAIDVGSSSRIVLT